MSDCIVLGISDSHDAAVALSINGKIEFAIAEERLSRVKHHAHEVRRSIQYVLDAAGIAPEEIDLVVVNSLDPQLQRPEADIEFRARLAASAKQYLSITDHHLLHAASTYFTSTFDNAAVLVADGLGALVQAATSDQPARYEALTIFDADAAVLTPVHRVLSTHTPYEFHREDISYGRFYSYASKRVFSSRNDAGKVMGLAAFGDPNRVQSFFDDGSFPRISPRRLAEEFSNRSRKRHYWHERDLAARVQCDLERGLAHYWELAHALTQKENICIAGGVGLNCSANGLLQQRGIFSNSHFFPAAGDDGIAIGAALFGHACILGNERPREIFSPYLGKPYSDSRIESAVRDLASTGCRAEKLDEKNLVQSVASALANGAVVAWFRGRSEFGPRALCSRSILASPRQATMRDFINSEIKGREFFRPLAPVILETAAHEYFEVPQGYRSPFMLAAVKSKPTARGLAPAVVHIDGTARVQTVALEQNPVVFELLRAFASIDGLPMLLNTSLNGEDEPIVETPEEAIELFKKTPIDFLAVGNWLVTKEQRLNA